MLQLLQIVMMMYACKDYADLQLNESTRQRYKMTQKVILDPQGEEDTPVTFLYHLVGQQRGE